MDGSGYLVVAAVAGLAVAGWLLRRALTDEQQQDPRLMLLLTGAVALAIVAGIVVGALLG